MSERESAARHTDPPAGVCYIVSYDHGGLVLWGYDHFVRHLREMLGWLDRYPELKMGLDNEAWMYDWLAENQPAVLAELRAALEKYSGRLGIATCTYGQPLAHYILEESNIRQIALGIETVRERLGYEVSIYSFSEHAAFPQVPQIASGLGLTGALMRTHYLMYGFCPGYDLPVAWWEAPDSTRIACVPTYVHQERQAPGHKAHPPGPYGLTTEDTWILTRYPSAESPFSLDHFRERFAHINPLVASRIDDSGLKKEQLVQELAGRKEYRWATLEDVFAGSPEPRATISPAAEDFRTRMPWGYRGNELIDLSRRAEIALLTAERLVARCAASQAGDYEPALRQAWKDLLVGQHHDAQIVARAGAFGRERLFAALRPVEGIVRRVLAGQTVPGSREGGSFTAFNPLPWPRYEVYAQLPDGTPLAGQTTAPALGWSEFTQASEESPAEPAFATDAYRVEIDPTGGIVRLEHQDGAPVLRPGRRSGELAGVIEGDTLTGAGTAQVSRSDAGYHVRERGRIGTLPYTIAWFFPHRGERIDCRIAVRFDGERIGAPTTDKRDSRSCFLHEEKLRIRFFAAVDPAEAIGAYDLPFGIATTRRAYVEGNYWTALGDEHGGLAIANRGTMGSVREQDHAFSVPLAFSTSYIWGAEVICGEREWALGLLPWRGNWAGAGLHRRALEFAFPLVAVPGKPATASSDRLRIDNPDIQLTALYPSGGLIYARVFNSSGEPQQLKWAGAPDAAVLVDLRHREMGEARLPMILRPWQFATLRLPGV